MLFISVSTLFYLILENMSANVRYFRLPCHILYYRSISLLPPILIDNLFETFYIQAV